MRLQLDLTRQAFTESQNNFTKDQAPVILAEPQRPEITAGRPLFWNVVISNFGRSTALNVRICMQIAHGQKIELDKIPVPTVQECDKTVKSSLVLPQGHKEYSTAFGPFRLDRDDVKLIKSTDYGAYVIGLVYYDDMSGHSYE